MPELKLRKIPFTVESENRLRMLKGRTGLDRNYLCRLGFCLSLEEAGVPRIVSDKVKTGREIDRYTLLGQYGQGYLALLLVWMKENNSALPPGANIDTMFITHMNRGVEIVASRVRNLSDIGNLLPEGRGPLFDMSGLTKKDTFG
jgi:DNA sulfur modification protein DndE